MKSLKNIMILIKVLRILCIIGLVFCAIGAVGAIIGMSTLFVVKDLNVGGKTVAEMMLEKGMTINVAYVSMANAVLICAANGALLILFEKFYRGIIDEGTPFKMETVKKMRKLAIIDIIVSFAVGILCAVSVAIARAIDTGLGKVDVNNYFSIGFAIFFLILSLFVEYGAELSEKKVEEEPVQIEEKQDEEK